MCESYQLYTPNNSIEKDETDRDVYKYLSSVLVSTTAMNPDFRRLPGNVRATSLNLDSKRKSNAMQRV